MIGRRAFLGGVALAGVRAAMSPEPAAAQSAVPNSAGTQPPAAIAPPHACDCHIHIYDPARFRMVPSRRVPPTEAAVPDYRRLQRRLGTARVVVVTPRNYGTENAVTVDAVGQLGAEARAVVVLHPSVTDSELRRLQAAGVRGVRFSLNDPATAVVSFAMVEPLSKRIADLGWHVQFNLDGGQIVESADLLRRLPSPLVFNHMGHPPLPAGIAHPSHRIILDLMQRGRTWVKLSGAYSNSTIGPPYPEAAAIARAFVREAPERLVWGSDWPHPTEPADRKPDDALLFDLLTEWAPDERIRQRILVENPNILYGFGSGH